jgi:uncharacterized membrane protein YbaN (DUF454 family)
VNGLNNGKLHLSPVRRYLLLGLGWFAVALGMIGVFLPVFPTTPFLLVALWLFSRSSDKFHGWLYHHRIFGPPLKSWERYRVVPWPAKLFAIGAMALSLSMVILFTEVPRWAITIIAAGMAAVAVFLLLCPSRIPSDAAEKQD